MIASGTPPTATGAMTSAATLVARFARAKWTVLVGRHENRETHANPAATGRVYDRQHVVN